MIIKVITCEDVNSIGKDETFVSHGVDVETLENIVLQSLPIDHYINDKWVIFDNIYGWILSNEKS